MTSLAENTEETLLGILAMLIRWGTTNYNLYEHLKITGMQTMLDLSDLIVGLLEREY